MIKVGVLRGGIGERYDDSLLAGGQVLSHLREDALNPRYQVLDVLIDRDGVWHLNGLPVAFDKLSRSVDVVFNALQGNSGKEEKIQATLERFGIPYTGSGSLQEAFSGSRSLMKEKMRQMEIKTTRHILIPAYQEDFDGPREEYARKKAREVFQKLSPPWVLKSLTTGSLFGVHVCKTLPELARTLEVSETSERSIIAEELINGKKSTVGVIEKFRGQNLYSLLPTGNFSTEEKKELERLAVEIHRGLGLRHFSQIEFVVAPNRGIHVLEINTLPDFFLNSAMEESLSAVGASLPEFLDHILQLALN